MYLGENRPSEKSLGIIFHRGNKIIDELPGKGKDMRTVISMLLLFYVSGCLYANETVMKEQYADLDGTSLYYKSAGAGVPIIFLHGGTSTSDSWRSYINKFSDSYIVIAPDSRGQGRSSIGKGPLTYERMAGDVVKLLDHLNIEKAHIVGHSDGGVVSLHLLIDYPDRVASATLLGTPYHIDNYPENAVKALEDYVQALADSDPAYDSVKSRHIAGKNPGKWATLINKLGTMWRTQPTFSKEEIKLINTPVLIIKTDRDFFIPPKVFDQMSSLIKHAKVKHIPNGTHSVYRKKFKEVSYAINEFIKSIEETNACKNQTIAGCNAKNMAPPMGWNSFDSYSCHLYEEVALKELDVFIKTYSPYGYEYYVIDNGWFAEHERIIAEGYRLPLRQHAIASDVRINKYGIVQPSKEGFPNGFKPLTDKLHAKGLKFGLHIMRGIPRKAVQQNTPIQGTPYRAKDIADVNDTCNWCNYMYGVDMNKPGAQQYYNNLIKQFADWGVDFIKVDDVIHKPREIEAYRKAIDNCSRPITLSLSPGRAADEDLVEDIYSQANMFRIVADVWDHPKSFKYHLDRYKIFGKYSRSGMWADLDMIPFGELCLLRRKVNFEESRKRGLSVKETRFAGVNYHWCHFNKDQKAFFLALRSIGCSPLMIGGSMISMDDESRDMLLDPEFIACNQNSVPGKVIHEDGPLTVLATQKKGTKGKGWIAILNTGPKSKTLTLTPKLLGHEKTLECQLIWENEGYSITEKGHKLTVPTYGGIFLKYRTN